MQIIVQWPGKSLKEAQKFAEHFGCKAYKTNEREYYRISSDDVMNFYWLGANVYNAEVNRNNPSGIAKFIEL